MRFSAGLESPRISGALSVYDEYEKESANLNRLLPLHITPDSNDGDQRTTNSEKNLLRG